MAKATHFRFFYAHSYSQSEQKHIKTILGNVSIGVVRKSQELSGHSYIRHIMWSSLQWHSLPVNMPDALPATQPTVSKH